MGRLFWGLLLSLVVFGGRAVQAAPFIPGDLFVAYGEHFIGVFRPDGTLAQILDTEVSTFTDKTTLGGGGGLALDEFGNLYVTVRKFRGNGRRGIVKFQATDGAKVLEIEGLAPDFRGLAVREGRIYVATGRGIRVFDAVTGERLSSADLGGNRAFRDIAFDRQGNLYALRRREIFVWRAGDLTGKDPTFSFSIPDEDPRALVTDDEGNIYIAFEETGIVRKYRPDGTLRATYLTPSGAGAIIGLDFDPGTGALFASHAGTGIGQILTVHKDAPDGTTMTAFGPTGLDGVRWLTVSPTPELPAPALLTIGVAGLWGLRRKRRGPLCGRNGVTD